jgi:Leucine-rich repeat (LRR) protein
MFFLPVNVTSVLPNLVKYSAWDCFITEVSKENFKGLINLNYLSLASNKIREIPTDTFEDLVNLRQLYLGKYYWKNFSTFKHFFGFVFRK